MGTVCFQFIRLNLRWYLLSISFVLGTVLGTYFLFSPRLSPTLERERLGFKSQQGIQPPPMPLFLICETPPTSGLPKGNFKNYKHKNTQVQIYCWSPELDPVTLLATRDPAL